MSTGVPPSVEAFIQHVVTTTMPQESAGFETVGSDLVDRYWRGKEVKPRRAGEFAFHVPEGTIDIVKLVAATVPLLKEFLPSKKAVAGTPPQPDELQSRWSADLVTAGLRPDLANLIAVKFTGEMMQLVQSRV